MKILFVATKKNMDDTERELYEITRARYGWAGRPESRPEGQPQINLPPINM